MRKSTLLIATTMVVLGLAFTYGMYSTPPTQPRPTQSTMQTEANKPATNARETTQGIPPNARPETPAGARGASAGGGGAGGGNAPAATTGSGNTQSGGPGSGTQPGR